MAQGSDVAGKSIEMGIKAVVGTGVTQGSRMASELTIKQSDVCSFIDC